ncbi:hypothetical protein ACTXT7_015144 [Hymenolepis weldensis]
MCGLNRPLGTLFRFGTDVPTRFAPHQLPPVNFYSQDHQPSPPTFYCSYIKNDVLNMYLPDKRMHSWSRDKIDAVTVQIGRRDSWESE